MQSASFSVSGSDLMQIIVLEPQSDKCLNETFSGLCSSQLASDTLTCSSQ